MYLIFLAGLLAVLAWTYFSKKLTLGGTITAGLLALLIFGGTGFPGLAQLGGFFVLGTTVTRWRRKDKVKTGLSEPGDSRRHAGQVLANGGVGGLAGLLALLLPQYRDLFLLLLSGAFAAAAADTVSSELGVLYGSRFYHILTGKPDQKGRDGVVSLEGTLLGVAGSSLMALLYVGTTGSSGWALVVLVVGGTAGNLADSLLGAGLERRGVLGNDAVNFINTLTGAGVVWLLHATGA